ncbi:hypothetical protein ACIPWE_24545 [Streptomyces sp. NPDC090073]|uniref:hypothetical protein n=1 Tax=Streptomyces sp. NPDC090073 TaxID=3365936 RepID=UPI0037F9BEFE
MSEPETPPLLLQLCAHVSGYEITTAQWARGHLDQHLSVVSFPREALAVYARQGFSELKRGQTRLLGRLASLNTSAKSDLPQSP